MRRLPRRAVRVRGRRAAVTPCSGHGRSLASPCSLGGDGSCGDGRARRQSRARRRLRTARRSPGPAPEEHECSLALAWPVPPRSSAFARCAYWVPGVAHRRNGRRDDSGALARGGRARCDADRLPQSGRLGRSRGRVTIQGRDRGRRGCWRLGRPRRSRGGSCARASRAIPPARVWHARHCWRVHCSA